MSEDLIISIPEEEPTYPLLGDRVQSTFIDMLFIVLSMFIFAFLLENIKDVPDWVRMGLFVFIWVIYEPLCTSLGCTIGNYIKGIRVRRYNNVDERINFFQAFIRYVFKCGLGWLSFVTIHGNKERRAIHDLVAGSVMIKH